MTPDEHWSNLQDGIACMFFYRAVVALPLHMLASA